MTRLKRALAELTEEQFRKLLTCTAVVVGLALTPMAIVVMEMF